MATDLFRVVAELHELIDLQFRAVSRPFTRDEATAFLQRSERIFTLLINVNTRSIEKLTDSSSFN